MTQAQVEDVHRKQLENWDQQLVNQALSTETPTQLWSMENRNTTPAPFARKRNVQLSRRKNNRILKHSKKPNYKLRKKMNLTIEPTSSRNFQTNETASVSVPASADANQFDSNRYCQIYSILLYFNVFFDLIVTPSLQNSFSASQTGHMQNTFTGMRISLFKNQILSQLIARLSSLPLPFSAETVYSIFLEIVESQGLMFCS